MSTDDPPRRWYRALVYSLFAPAVGLGVLPLIATLGDDPVVTVAAGFVVLGWVAAAPLLYLDATALGSHPPAQPTAEWSPSPARYATGGLLAGPLAVVYYLRQRHHHRGTAAGCRGWWLGVLGGVAGVVAFGSAFALGSESAATVVLAVAAACYALFPVGVYHDARNARAGPGDWSLEPATASLAATVSTVTLVLPPVLALAHLGQRLRTRESG